MVVQARRQWLAAQGTIVTGTGLHIVKIAQGEKRQRPGKPRNRSRPGNFTARRATVLNNTDFNFVRLQGNAGEVRVQARLELFTGVIQKLGHPL